MRIRSARARSMPRDRRRVQLRIAASTDSRVSGLTFLLPLMTRDTSSAKRARAVRRRGSSLRRFDDDWACAPTRTPCRSAAVYDIGRAPGRTKRCRAPRCAVSVDGRLHPGIATPQRPLPEGGSSARARKETQGTVPIERMRRCRVAGRSAARASTGSGNTRRWHRATMRFLPRVREGRQQRRHGVRHRRTVQASTSGACIPRRLRHRAIAHDEFVRTACGPTASDDPTERGGTRAIRFRHLAGIARTIDATTARIARPRCCRCAYGRSRCPAVRAMIVDRVPFGARRGRRPTVRARGGGLTPSGARARAAPV